MLLLDVVSGSLTPDPLEKRPLWWTSSSSRSWSRYPSAVWCRVALTHSQDVESTSSRPRPPWSPTDGLSLQCSAFLLFFMFFRFCFVVKQNWIPVNPRRRVVDRCLSVWSNFCSVRLLYSLLLEEMTMFVRFKRWVFLKRTVRRWFSWCKSWNWNRRRGDGLWFVLRAVQRCSCCTRPPEMQEIEQCPEHPKEDLTYFWVIKSNKVARIILWVGGKKTIKLIQRVTVHNSAQLSPSITKHMCGTRRGREVLRGRRQRRQDGRQLEVEKLWQVLRPTQWSTGGSYNQVRGGCSIFPKLLARQGI